MSRLIYILAMFLFAFSAYAEQNFYGTLGIGFVVPSKNTRVLDNSSYVTYGPTAAPSGESIFNLPNVDWQNKFRTGFNVSAATGYYFSSHWRGDIEFLYQRVQRKVVGTYNFIEFDALDLRVIDSANNIKMTASKGYLNIYSLLTNAYYDFSNYGRFKPMLGGGFGIAWVDAFATSALGSLTTSLGTTALTVQHSPKLSGTALALQFKAGSSYALNKSMSLMLQYRLFLTSNFIANKSSIITNLAAGTSARYFFISQQTISGMLTNALELLVKFDL